MSTASGSSCRTIRAFPSSARPTIAAAHLEPGNTRIGERTARVAALRDKGEPSVPSTLEEEHATNPFLRCDSAEIVANVAARLGPEKTPGAVLGAIRAAKDAF